MNDERIQTPQDEEAEFSEHARVRREKLAALKADRQRSVHHHLLPRGRLCQRYPGKIRGDGRERSPHCRPDDEPPDHGQGKPSLISETGTDRMQVYVKRVT